MCGSQDLLVLLTRTLTVIVNALRLQTDAPPHSHPQLSFQVCVLQCVWYWWGADLKKRYGHPDPPKEAMNTTPMHDFPDPWSASGQNYALPSTFSLSHPLPSCSSPPLLAEHLEFKRLPTRPGA